MVEEWFAGYNQKMAESSKRQRKRGRVTIEPLVFQELPEVVRDQIRKREPQLRAAGLWEFLCRLEISWPWQADLSEFFESALASEFREIKVQNESVQFNSGAIAKATTLPEEDGQPLLNAELPISAREWEVVFKGGSLAFDSEAMGWCIELASSPWKEWLEVFHQRIQLGEEGSKMEHCMVCAAFTALMRGTRYNWAEELRLRMQEEIEKQREKRPVPLRCAGYMGILCQLSVASSSPSSFRSVPPFLSRPRYFAPSPERRIVMSPIASPDPPEIVEESIELCGDFASIGGPRENFQVLPRLVVPSQIFELGSELSPTPESHDREGVIHKLQAELTLAKEKESQLQGLNISLQIREAQLEEKLTESVKSQKEWQDKCGMVFTELTLATNEKNQLVKEKEALEREKNIWEGLRVRQEKAIASKSKENQSLKAQIQAVFVSEREILESGEKIKELEERLERQNIELEAKRRRIERMKSGVWAIESVCPPFTSLFKNFELQRDIFFLVYSLQSNQILSNSDFEKLWAESLMDGCENLLTEILVRGGLRVTDPFKMFQSIAEFGVRIFTYYTQLELSLQQRRHQVAALELNPPQREVDLQLWNVAVDTALTICPLPLLKNWAAEFARVRSSLRGDNFLQAAMDASSERLATSKRLDLGPGHYQFKYDQLKERMHRMDQQMEQTGGRAQVNLQNQVTFFLPPPNQVHRMLNTPSRVRSPLAHKFLGEYEALFDEDVEQPIPTWKALEWILEDVGQSRQVSTDPSQSHDKVYRRICAGWSREPPLNVRNDLRFCNCPRRYKWPTNALVDSLEYNWPLIPGSFMTPQDCNVAYMQFSFDHRQHRDPVCFRAAIFAAILGSWCLEYNFTYNVNLLSKTNREALILTKINYRSARWLRCMEAMCSTYFIIGPHHSLINEFGATRYGVISRALQVQREVENTIVPEEETMRPDFVAEYGPSSQRPFRNMGGPHRGRRR